MGCYGLIVVLIVRDIEMCGVETASVREFGAVCGRDSVLTDVLGGEW